MSLGAGTAVPCPYKGKMRPDGLGAVRRRPYNSEEPERRGQWRFRLRRVGRPPKAFFSG